MFLHHRNFYDMHVRFSRSILVEFVFYLDYHFLNLTVFVAYKCKSELFIVLM